MVRILKNALVLKIFFAVVLFHLTQLLYSQDEKVRLAFQYYQTKEFEKSAILFEELFEQSGAQVYFTYTVNSLLEIKEFDRAEKIIKKQIRKNKDELTNYIEYGYLFKKKGNNEEAAKQFDYVLKNLNTNSLTINQIANSFITKREYEYALQTYLKAAKLTNSGFHAEIANVYAFQRRSQEMVDIYLDLLKTNPAQMDFVQSNLQARMSNTFDENMPEILRKSLIKRIQKDPKDLIFSEMLLWHFVQMNDYGNAIIQAISLDKKLNEGGMRLIELGNIARSNNMFPEALEAYQYVLNIGKESGFYPDAKLGFLDVFYEQIELGIIYDVSEFQRIEKMYLETIKEFGNHQQTIRLIKDLAHLQAFYLNKGNEAIELLIHSISTIKMAPLIKGACKIELGDVYLMTGKVSDAILEYAQAAKMNEDTEIGDQAKLKRAMLAFYTGNFQWAQAQLDVLKTGTSKLIANDAFVLAMLIKDNSGFDSTETALKYFAKAEMLLQQKKQAEALKTLDTLEIQFSTHSLIDDVYFLKARIFEKSGNLEKAVFNYQVVSEKYGIDLLGDDACFKLAQIYDYQLNDKKKAMEYYKKIIFDYAGSIFVVDARNRFRILRDGKDMNSN